MTHLRGGLQASFEPAAERLAATHAGAKRARGRRHFVDREPLRDDLALAVGKSSEPS